MIRIGCNRLPQRTNAWPVTMMALALIFPCLFPSSSQSVQAQEAAVAEAWSAWDQMPLLHDGRLKPMDTFARQAVQIISHRESPKLVVDGEIQKWEADKMVLSWLLLPQKWEDVEFLYAKLPELREEILDIPLTGKDGETLSYVSPAQLEEQWPIFFAKWQEIQQKRQKAQRTETTFEAVGLDKAVEELFEAYFLYRNLQLNSVDARTLVAVKNEFGQAHQRWQQFAGLAQFFQPNPENPEELGSVLAKFRNTHESLSDLLSQIWVEPAELDETLYSWISSAKQIADSLDFARRQLEEGEGPPNSQQLGEQLLRLQLTFVQIAQSGEVMQEALYGNREELVVIPALNAEALEAFRNPEQEISAWLDLQSVLKGSLDHLEELGYPRSEIERVRGRFASLEEVANAPESRQFGDALSAFVSSIRYLGTSVDDMRADLDLKDRDEALLAATAYPPTDAMALEVHYNHFDPFGKSWMISGLALLCFCLAFGVMRKWMFWAALTVMTVGMAICIYGFAIRVAITGWAPVTNMYETVIYVALCVSIMGAWFILSPLTTDGLRLAWRLTAVPLTWEASKLSPIEERAVGTEKNANLISLAFLLPRIALMGVTFYILSMAPYAAGDRVILPLLPQADVVGSAMPSFQKLLAWAVGLAVLIPSVWYIPRAVMMMLIGVVTIPLARLKSKSSVMQEVYARWPFGVAATFAATLGAFTAWFSTSVLDGNFKALQPVLRDNFWLAIHVITIVSSYAAGMLAWGLGNISLGYFLFGKYRDPVKAGAKRRPPASCTPLSQYIYKSMQVAVLLLAAGTILGGLWADVSWGRFWGWDPKEVWALISLLVYLAILHGRFVNWFGSFGLAAGSVLGASAIIMSWYGVNFVLGAGLHSYGFGNGGMMEVGLAVLLNWTFLAMAFTRYRLELADRGEAAQKVAPASEDEELSEESAEAEEEEMEAVK
ncbi:putative cytochrome C-type biogenesis protein [Planctomycetales bacterium 10988]|nr:putative cytochrome C-type biogenesis protein [Planctomycetales bacterium 10988]